MSINGINTQNQNYAASGATNTKSNNVSNAFDTFQKELLKWEKRIKDSIDKEQENDRNGSIQMSEKQWRNLMGKVDSAINTLNDNIKKREQGEKQPEEKNLTLKDTVASSFQTDNTNIHFLHQEYLVDKKRK